MRPPPAAPLPEPLPEPEPGGGGGGRQHLHPDRDAGRPAVEQQEAHAPAHRSHEFHAQAEMAQQLRQPRAERLSRREGVGHLPELVAVEGHDLDPRQAGKGRLQGRLAVAAGGHGQRAADHLADRDGPVTAPQHTVRQEGDRIHQLHQAHAPDLVVVGLQRLQVLRSRWASCAPRRRCRVRPDPPRRASAPPATPAAGRSSASRPAWRRCAGDCPCRPPRWRSRPSPRCTPRAG